jgi:translocation and assembly module TamB
MPNSPNPNSESIVRPRWRLRRILFWGGVGCGVTLLTLGTTASWLIRYRLAPIISNVLEGIIQRPADVGPVERITLNSIRFGRSSIPATATDTDRAEVGAVEVNFSVLSLFQPKVQLDITLVNPNIYIEQNSSGNWIDTKLKLDPNPPVTLVFRTIGIENAQINLMPYALLKAKAKPIVIAVDQIKANLTEDQQQIQADLKGKFAETGTFAIKADALLETGKVNAQIQANSLDLSHLAWFVETPGISIKQGKLNTNLNVKLDNYQPLDIKGTLNLDQVKVAVDSLPQPVNLSQAKLRFSGTQLIIDQLNTTMGDLALGLTGSVLTNSDLDLAKTQVNLAANLQPVQVSTLLKTVETIQGKPLTLPFPITGELKANLNLKGNLNSPKLSGTIATTQQTLLDRVYFDNIQTNFNILTKFDPNFNILDDPIIEIQNLLIQPSLGGLVTGKGEIKLAGLTGLLAPLTKPQTKVDPKILAKLPPNSQISQAKTELNPIVKLDFNVNDIPVDAIAKSYEFTPSFKIENLSANGQISGDLENLKADTQFSLPSAIYPISGEAQLSGNTAKAQIKIAEGNLNIIAQPTNNQIWNAEIIANQLSLTPLVDLGLLFAVIPDQTKQQIQSIDLTDGQLNLVAKLSANLQDFSLNSLKADSQIQLDFQNSTIKAIAKLQNGLLQTDFSSDNLALPRIINIGLPFANLTDALTSQIQSLDISQGSLQIDGFLSGKIDNFSPNNFNGNAKTVINLGQLGGIITANSQLNQGQFKGQFNAQDVQLNSWINLGLPLANLPANLKNQIQTLDFRNSRLTGEGNITGNLTNFNLNTLIATGLGQVNLGNFGGIINAEGQLANNQLTGQVITDQIPLQPLINLGLPLANLQPNLVAEINALNFPGGFLQGSAKINGNLTNFSPNNLIAFLDSQVNLGRDGGVILATAETRQGQWKTTIKGDQIALGRFSQLVESQMPNSLRQNGLLQQAENMPLLRGLLTTEITGEGNLNTFNPKTIQALGQLRLTELPIIKQPFEAIASWNGREINIKKAETQGFSTDGLIGVEFQGNGIPQLSNLNLNVRADNFDLQSPLVQNLLTALPLEITTGESALVAGIVDFNGKLTGTPSALNLNGNLRLNNFAVRDVTFEPILAGTINIIPNQQVNIALAGERDKIELALDNQYLPTSFLVKRNDSQLVGNSQGNNLEINLDDFPLQTLSLSPLAELNIGLLKGIASGQLTVSNLASFDINKIGVIGKIAIQKPILGYIETDLFLGNFSYQNGIAKLTDAELSKGMTEILINGQANVSEILASLSTPPTQNLSNVSNQFEGTIKIPQGSLQDILTALKIFNLADFGRGLTAPNYGIAADVKPVPVGLPSTATLFEQLQRLEEIRRILQESLAEIAAEPLPPLQDLDGKFTGEIAFQGSIPSGINATATIKGQDWNYGKYTADQFLLEANFADNLVRVEPIQLRAGSALYDFRGQLNLANQQTSGQFRGKNIRLEEIEKIVDLPNVDLTGQLNIRASIAGTLENPQSSGELTLLEATVNDEPIQEAQSSFSYNNARLRFGGSLLVTETDPISFRGTLPFKLPFAKVTSESDVVDVRVDIKDQGLAVINLLNPELSWQEGKGLVQLRISGSLQQPETGGINLDLKPEGLFKIQDAVLIARSLEQSIVGLSGTAVFIGDRIQVKDIQGDLQGDKGTGHIRLSGVLPVSHPLDENDPDLQTPLQLDLEQLTLNLPELYKGNADGAIIIKGTVLKPKLGGEVILSQGKVTLPSEQTATLPTDTISTTQPPVDVSLNGLKLTLGEDIQVMTPPILNAPLINFNAQGTIELNGSLASLDNIRPEGTIDLTGGQVNLYTSQLRLDRGYPQRAIFVPSQGLDPILDVRLVTRVPETLRFVSPPSAFPAEQTEALSPSRLGTVRTIRITAIVRGSASEINDIIKLQSSPSRSQNELVALLGGSVIQGIQDDSTLVLANIASTGLFGKLQQNVINATGLTEFRIYPSRVAERGSKGTASALGVGIEVGLDVTDNAYVSLSRVLAADQPFQFNINYRLNDNILLRGVTNFRNESEIRFEYETRF